MFSRAEFYKCIRDDPWNRGLSNRAVRAATRAYLARYGVDAIVPPDCNPRGRPGMNHHILERHWFEAKTLEQYGPTEWADCLAEGWKVFRYGLDNCFNIVVAERPYEWMLSASPEEAFGIERCRQCNAHVFIHDSPSDDTDAYTCTRCVAQHNIKFLRLIAEIEAAETALDEFNAARKKGNTQCLPTASQRKISAKVLLRTWRNSARGNSAPPKPAPALTSQSRSSTR